MFNILFYYLKLNDKIVSKINVFLPLLFNKFNNLHTINIKILIKKP
jgi:hypothetical protein